MEMYLPKDLVIEKIVVTWEKEGAFVDVAINGIHIGLGRGHHARKLEKALLEVAELAIQRTREVVGFDEAKIID